ncbi:Clavaminate synthase [Fusarium sp. NRRL 52700]|nr:Clavaminate synthase [Fusarium sp. NRRL 52700]
MKYDVDKIGSWKLNGYTAFGRNAGLTGDGMEGYAFPRDGICNPIVDGHSLSLPHVLQDEAHLLVIVMDKLHEIGSGLLEALDQISHDAGLNTSTPLAPKHLPTDPSTSCMTVQRYPSLSTEGPDAFLSAHTDIGSLITLFCGDRGLQAFNQDTQEWKFVEPHNGCAVVNVDDSLRFLPGRKFRSVVHRAAPYPGETIENRFSCAHFMRPRMDVSARFRLFLEYLVLYFVSPRGLVTVALAIDGHFPIYILLVTAFISSSPNGSFLDLPISSTHLDEPTAHFVGFYRTPSSITQLRLKVTTNQGLDEALNPPGGLTALMRACKVSKYRTETILRRWRPQKPLSLHYMESNAIRSHTGLHFGIPPNTWAGRERESIDVSQDLIILVCRLPFATTWARFPAVECIGILYQVDPLNINSQSSSVYPVQHRSPLHYPMILFWRFPRLRFLYIIVKPEDVNDTADPPLFAENMTNYHQDYQQTVDRFPRREFNARQRIYYERPELRCRGLETIYKELKEAVPAMDRVLGQDFPSLVIRVMTWKHVAGVRGRFDRD